MFGQWPSERSRGIPPCATHARCLPPPRLRHSTVATYKAAQDGLVGAHLSRARAGVARRPTQARHPSRFRGAPRGIVRNQGQTFSPDHVLQFWIDSS
eukprot:COSAG06_NODE_425_length_15907_cov_254.424469_2_plen_97_part_00